MIEKDILNETLWVRHFNWGLERDILSETFWSAFFGAIITLQSLFFGSAQVCFCSQCTREQRGVKKEGGTTLIKLQQSTCAKVQPSLVSTLESTFTVQVCTNEKQHRVQQCIELRIDSWPIQDSFQLGVNFKYFCAKVLSLVNLPLQSDQYFFPPVGLGKKVLSSSANTTTIQCDKNPSYAFSHKMRICYITALQKDTTESL